MGDFYLRQDLGDTSGLKVTPLIQSPRASVLPFTLEYIGDYRCDNSFFVDRSGYHTCLLIYTLSGEGLIRYEDKEYTTHSGEAVIFNCLKPQYYATKGQRWHFLWLHIGGSCAFDYADMLNENMDKPLYLGNRLPFQSVYDKLRLLSGRFDAMRDHEIAVSLHGLLTDMFQLKCAEELGSRLHSHHSEILECIAYIQQKYMDALTVEELAERCHLNRFYFIKTFKTCTGRSPYEYILEFRLKQAQKRLLETAEPVAQIAVNCGFSDSKNLIFHFRKRFDTTPLQYRKQYRNDSVR